ncbi:U2 snRNP-associated SURP domain-containing protein [Orbilia blumenaviensis]|uniref:U2 snRNP-associated SURP domain-containing protein n=1 Tax=Orbilia blumenaviensis TaxID=1796055 RepID=A0AAV9VAN8_9PEZI
MSGFQFPNIKEKLEAPTKKSAFERAKAEAEAKRKREAEETAAVYKEFVESFEDNSRPSYSRGSDRGGFGGSRSNFGPSRAGPTGLGKRHFTTGQGRSAISGPGTLGPLPTKKRDLDTYQSEGSYGRGGGGGAYGKGSHSTVGVLGFDEGDGFATKAAKSERGMKFGEDDEDDDEFSKSKKEQAKPTISMTHLPSKTTKSTVMEMMQPYFPKLTANQVSMQAVGGAGGTGRKSMSALVTLQTDTAASEIDAAVNGLSNKYMGFGFRLGISRHLPSTVIGSTITPTVTGQSAAPFNACPVFSGAGRGGFGRGGFAPPSSFGHSSSTSANNSKYVVSVNAPKDLKTLRLIHKTVEAVITHGPEFEALLMAMPSIISDERYFWLWDNKSTEHVYYRWRLWDVFTASGSASDRKQRSYAGTTITHIFDNSISWELPPKKQQKFEYVTELKDFIEDEEYHSSSDEDDDAHQAQDSNPNAEDTKTYLGPLRRAKLYHLLSRVPITTGTLRRGDVARVSGFAVEHAYAAEEIVEIMCANVSRPVAFSSANPNHEPSSVLTDKSGNANVAKEDQTPAKLIALYLISDVLSNSGLGVRNVWRYRQYFDQRLREGKIFEGLAEVGEKENWGKIRQEKWRRSIQVILSLWENWNIFPQTSHEALRVAFSEPAAPQQAAAIPEITKSEAAPPTLSAKSRWRTVPEDQETGQPKFNPYLADSADNQEGGQDVDGEELIDDDVDGEPMEEDEDVDGEPMVEDEDEDGEPMVEEDNEEVGDATEKPEEEVDMFIKDAEAVQKEPPKIDSKPMVSGVTLGSGFGFKIGGFGAKVGAGAGGTEEGRKKRMKAEDMFANDDSDG